MLLCFDIFTEFHGGLVASLVHLDKDITDGWETVVLNYCHVRSDQIFCRFDVIDFVQFGFSLPESVEYSHVVQITVCLVAWNTLSIGKILTNA